MFEWLISRAQAASFFDSISNMHPESYVTTVDSSTNVWVQMGTIINYFLTAIGLVMLLTLIYAGVTILTSHGDEDTVSKARKMIVYAIAGIVIISLAYTINSWIFDSSFFKDAATGTGVTAT